MYLLMSVRNCLTEVLCVQMYFNGDELCIMNYVCMDQMHAIVF